MELASLLRRDRWLTIVGLMRVLVIAGGDVLHGAGMEMSARDMTRMPRDMAMPQPAWTLRYAALMFAMWWLLTAMMLPSATPVLLLAAALNRRAPRSPAVWRDGAIRVWLLRRLGGFSAVAVAVQAWLSANGSLSSMLHVGEGALAGVILIAAGLWQWTPLKHACLRHCRSPVRFLAARRRSGNVGAFAMGAEHGAYCVGCCWLMMALLFVGGVMNLYWIAALAGYVLAEKLLPAGERRAHRRRAFIDAS